jgi:hypothetical protein
MMITLKDFMDVVGHRVSEGSNYGWECYGPNAYMLDSWNGDQDGHSATIIFDTKTQVVYEVELHDYAYNKAYRVINPDYAKSHKKEAKRRDVDLNQAWDCVEYVDVSVLEMISAMKNTFQEDTSFTMPMPGTMGGAKLIFPEDTMSTFNVKLDVRYELEVKAESMDEAVEKAKHFQETMPKGWGDHNEFDVCWVDTYVVKESAERETNI